MTDISEKFAEALQPPNLENAERFLSTLRGTRVFVPHLRGNNGDTLLEMALDSQCAKQGLRKSWRAQGAEWICFHGSGAMNDFWCDGFHLLGTHAKDHPDKPIVVLPSSYHFTTTDLSKLLSGRSAPTVLFVREKTSYARLSQVDFPENVHLGLDHDTALWLAEEPLVQKLKAYRERQPRDYVLIVERADLEHHGSTAPLERMQTFVSHETKVKALARYYLGPSRDVYRRWKWRKKGLWACEPLSEGFEQECRTFLEEWHPTEAKLPWRTGDVSLPLRYSFNDFCRLIAGAAVVVTNRMHAGVLAHMIGIPVGFRDGRYGKIRGVYEQSLADRPDVRIFENGKVLDIKPPQPAGSSPEDNAHG